MSKVHVQSMPLILEHTSGCLAANGSLTGSLISYGYARLVGGFRSDVATETASGLRIEQSFDGGSNWDLVSASDLVGASGIATCSVEVLGDAVRVTIRNGATEASALRTTWRLRPI